VCAVARQAKFEVGVEDVNHTIAVGAHIARAVEAIWSRLACRADLLGAPCAAAIGGDVHVDRLRITLTVAVAAVLVIADIDVAKELAGGGVVGPDLLLSSKDVALVRLATMTGAIQLSWSVKLSWSTLSIRDTPRLRNPLNGSI
jgi:hypothetical protein